MEIFAPSDRVVAINTDVSFPLRAVGRLREIRLPDGTLRKNTVYHVESVKLTSDGLQGLFITGLHAFYGNRKIAFHYSRFRKVDFLSGHASNKRAADASIPYDSSSHHTRSPSVSSQCHISPFPILHEPPILQSAETIE